MFTAAVKEPNNYNNNMGDPVWRRVSGGGASAVGGDLGLILEVYSWRERVQRREREEKERAERQRREEEEKERAERQRREREEKERAERQRREWKEKLSREKNTLTLLFYLGLSLCICLVVSNHRVNMMSSNPVQEKMTNKECYSETSTLQTHMNGHHDQTEQTGSDQQGGGGQGGGGQGDEERDEESDSEEEESDSEEETEDDERKQRNRKKKCHEKKGTQSKERGVSEGVMETETGQDINARNIETNNVDQQSNQETNHRPAAISLGLLNTRSLNNKPLRILELITGNDLDVFLTTEKRSQSPHTGFTTEFPV